MPEQAYTPPETKYEVHINELMKAIRGEDFVQGNGLWRMRGWDIISKQLVDTDGFDFDGSIEYVILHEARIKEPGRITQINSEITNYHIGFIFSHSIIPDIFFTNSQTECFYFWGCHLGSINISDSSRTGVISIENSKTFGITIKDNSTTSQIHIYRISQSDEITIANNSKVGAIIIDENSQTGNITIDNYSQSDLISLRGKSKSGRIDIFSNLTPLSISITEGSRTGNFSFKNAKLAEIIIDNNFFGLTIYNTQILSMIITSSCITQFIWDAATKGEVYISKQCKILLLSIANTTLLKDSILSLSDTAVCYLIIYNAIVQGNILLREIRTSIPIDWKATMPILESNINHLGGGELLYIQKKALNIQSEKHNAMLLKLVDTYGDQPIFRISHSSLGKTEITGCDFSGFQFQYYNSNLLGCFITGTQLPKRNMVIYDPVTDKVLNNESNSHALFEQKTAVYNQFKKIYENQGDVVEASVFHAQAMHWQQKLLWRQFRHDKEGFWKRVKLFSENIGFRLNWFSNNHGESWLVALVFTIGVGLVFFIASIWGLTHWGDGKTLWDNIHKLPGFMLPTHSYDYLSKDIIETTKATYPHLKVNLWHTLWDFMGRIFVGYGIFQFISAFRRHGKKGG